MRVASSLMPPSGVRPPGPFEALGPATLDAALGGGLALGRVHEIYGAEPDDAAAAIGFGMALAGIVARDAARPALWLRSRRAGQAGGVLQAQGWAELGGTPGPALLGLVPDGMALLRATVDALRCPSLGVVVAEGWGNLRELDLTASRRLTLAAEKSGVTLLLVRPDAAPAPSAAQTRWQVTSAPSRPLPGRAPGAPVFDLTLLRQKSGPCGLNWQLEWDRDRRIFREAPSSGALVSLPADRPAAAGAGWQRSPSGRSAA